MTKKRSVGLTALVLILLIILGIVAVYNRSIFSRVHLFSPAPAGDRTFGLRKVADIPLAGGTSRFDYQSLDPSRNQLYIAHLAASLVTVFDIQARKVIADIPDISQVHGVLVVPQLGRVYASATGDNQVVTIDEQSLRVTHRTDGGGYPDGIAYDPDDKKLFVSDEFGKTVTVIDTQTNARIATIDMGGEVGNTQYDPLSHRVFSAVQTRNQVVAIDPKRNQVIGRYDVPGCNHPHSLYIDATARVVFVACEENATLVALDVPSMQPVATMPVGETPDVLAYDSGLHRLYVAAESGVLTIVGVQGKTIKTIAQDFFADHAHTIAVDPQTHRVYLPLENVNGQPVLRIMEPA